MGRRLIDTDAAYAVLTDYYHHSTDTQHAALKEARGRGETGDAVPVRHGIWWHYEGMLTCSECGTQFYDNITEYCGDHVPKFCPECGAKMDGKDGDNG